MADPNTQIDWWIAQAWQEAQGGADNDSLVAWLHENGLTAVSSYTILQAALSCSSDEAKQMVFNHPLWAGEDVGQDLSGIEYTADTLEPEPEPDPTFELDDWAEEVEEQGPVYGEEGYRVDPQAGASPPVEADGLEDRAEASATGYADQDHGEMEGPGLANWNPAEPTDEFEPETEMDPEPFAQASTGATPEATWDTAQPDDVTEGYSQDYDLASAPSEPSDPVARMPVDNAQIGDAGQRFEDAAVSANGAVPGDLPAEISEDRQDGEAEALPMAATIPPNVYTQDIEALDTEADAPPTAQPSVAPRETVLPEAPPPPAPAARTPPSTPAERAAVFAAAFGKKPAGQPAPQTCTDETPDPRSEAPPSTDMGPASYAENAPAPTIHEHPQPTMAAAPLPSSPTFDPVPEEEVSTEAEALFGTIARSADAPQPLFQQNGPSPATGGRPAEGADSREAAGIETAAAEEPVEETLSGAAPDFGERQAELGRETYDGTLDDDSVEAMDGISDVEVSLSDEEAFEPGPESDDDLASGIADEGTHMPENLQSDDLWGDLPPGIQAALSDAADQRPDIEAVSSLRDESEEAAKASRVAETPAESVPEMLPDDERTALDVDTEADDFEDPSMAAADSRVNERNAEAGEAVEHEAPPRKRLLLDPNEEQRQSAMRQPELGALAAEAGPDAMEAAATRLGIDFKMGDPTEAGIDPVMSQAAKELGISFRETPGQPAEELDETALAAQKLGISFRDPALQSDKVQKPFLVKYLPLLLGIIVILFILMAAAPFATRISAWL